MKPTQVSCPKGGLNQIPGECTISGDIRLTPFYKVEDARDAVMKYVEEINADLSSLPMRGPCSKLRASCPLVSPDVVAERRSCVVL
jgi:acetylornithine deacetylase